MSNKSKGVHLKNYMRRKELIRLRKLGYSWKMLADKMKMDRNNARREVLKE